MLSRASASKRVEVEHLGALLDSCHNPLELRVKLVRRFAFRGR
jgi:hypothetical protein